ncbi:MAG: hypothetical protein IJT41_13385 [Clostridia bacterium]|nr:hypothetical protein [Clostridia bacterium]
MEITVRPYTEADRDAVRLICVATAQHRVRSETRRFFVLKTSCDYYLECEPENCFVAVRTQADGSEKIVGYVLCAADCETYARRYLEKYIPKIKEYSKLHARVARGDVMMVGQFAAFFPAHLRLALLPEERAGEAGELLVRMLVAHLTEQRSKGVCVILNKKNAEERDFFKRCGFSFLRQIGAYAAYGLDL